MKNRWLRILWTLFLALLLCGTAAFAALADNYTLTVEYGSGGGTYAAGEVVKLGANAAPGGQTFYRWEADAGLLGLFSDAYSAEAQFTMPAADATVRATYTGKTRVTISGVSVAGKEYDGEPVAPSGTPTSAASAGYDYTYYAAGSGAALAGPPTEAGAYYLIVTVKDTDASYFGTSGAIHFTITAAATPAPSTPAPSTPAPTGTVAITGDVRYGQVLTAAYSGSEDVTYTWYREHAASDIELGTGNSYTVAEADIGGVLYVVARAEGMDDIRSGNTAAAEKALYTGAGPATPSAKARTTTSVTLNTASECEYSKDGTTWGEGSFVGLEPGTTYSFYCRVKETATTLPSASSPAASIATYGALGGTISVAGSLTVGSQLTASLSGDNDPAALAWQWKRDGAVVGNTASYTVTAADVGKALLVEVTSTAQSGTVSHAAGTCQRAAYPGTTPAAPEVESVTGTSVTLKAADGYEYSMDGQKWQTNTAFTGLIPETEYTFYQRVRETDTQLCSATSAGLRVRTVPTLTGTVYISGEARYGKTLVASFSPTDGVGALTYTWKRGTMTVGTGVNYDVQAVDIGNQLSVEVTSSTLHGSVKRIIGQVAKAEYVGNTPAAPTRLARTTTSITLASVPGNEYSLGGTKWQSSNRFTGLSAGKTYKFYQRVAATATVEASPASAAASIATSAAAASDNTQRDDDDDDNSGAGVTGATAAVYNLTLTGENTRVLSTAMSGLIKGNETQDVSVRLDNASFTFFKNTMEAIPGKLWYDFGVKINSCIHEQAARDIAGEHYVATVHYNYDGALPASANIRLWLGAAHAGKTLYYYKLDPAARSLSYMQAVVADTGGWATVVQDSCSDYVFCDAEILSVLPTPTPPPATPSPTPEVAPMSVDTPAKTKNMSGWVFALFICAALLLIVGGIWLYVRNRD